MTGPIFEIVSCAYLAGDFGATGFLTAGFAFAAGFAAAAAGLAGAFVAGLAAVFAAGLAAAGLAADVLVAVLGAAGFLAAGFLAADGSLPFLLSYTFLPATAAAAVAMTAPATAAVLPGFSLIAEPADAAALEAASTADFALVDALSDTERALPVRSSAKLRSLFITLLSAPVSSGFFGMIRSSLSLYCNNNRLASISFLFA
jgi:hypothetical protein